MSMQGENGPETEVKGSGSVVALEAILGRYAWAKLVKTTGFLKRLFLNEADFYPDPDWRAVSLEHRLVAIVTRRSDAKVDTPAGLMTTGSRWVTLYKCEFENVTDCKTSHKFRGRRETTTWVTVDLSCCYTIQGEVTIDVSLPTPFLKCRAGRDSGLPLNKMKGQVLKEVLTWDVDSQVDLQPNFKAYAQLQALEECQVLDLEIHTAMKVPSGLLPVHFKRKSDDKVAYTVMLPDWERAFRTVEEGGCLEPEIAQLVQILWERSVDSQGRETSGAIVQLLTRGVAISVAWSDQRVDIRTEPVSVLDIDQQSIYNGDTLLNAHV